MCFPSRVCTRVKWKWRWCILFESIRVAARGMMMFFCSAQSSSRSFSRSACTEQLVCEIECRRCDLIMAPSALGAASLTNSLTRVWCALSRDRVYNAETPFFKVRAKKGIKRGFLVSFLLFYCYARARRDIWACTPAEQALLSESLFNYRDSWEYNCCNCRCRSLDPLKSNRCIFLY